MIEDVKLDFFYPHPPLRVWKALTDRSALAAWMMENDFEPRLGHKFRFFRSPQSGSETTIHCEVMELDEPKRLVYSWQDSPTHKPCLVIWTLTPVEGGTQLHLEHQEFRLTVAVSLMRNRSVQEQRSGGTVMFLYETVSSTPTLMAECYSPQLKSPTVHDELNHTVVLDTHPMNEWEYRLGQKLPEVLLHC